MSDNQSVEIFNSWDLYDNIVRRNWMRHKEMADFIHRVAGELTTSGLSILDLGCGDGAMARNGLSGCPIQKYVGVDLSQDALRHLKQSQGLGDDPQVIHGDLAESIAKLPADGFDLVLASYSIHHFPRDQKQSILDHVRRVLRAGGRFVWIDIACLDGEDRSGYVSRIEHEIRTHWKPMSDQVCQETLDHIRNYDFPEQQGWMIDAWHKASLEAGEKLQSAVSKGKKIGFRDTFYVGLCLD
jgi:ubiquinone/menaquinone biosynthesis C-methylase UbiE